ncbi:hypothetical protein Poli38472_003017 [Pythium oligandrum]|uniref:FYVE-type domain-containing protein n=1 Tax=Pythium oligandrum TaxID=41045 RepID=A0A8K1FEX5_PYTOL|nr:hypothetical protein Poli38472_003017 [Pythium oligandrum]|eukprot:TMW57092.1 hypothetical protein Poli38472_003017 [Pythium oligandrum]
MTAPRSLTESASEASSKAIDVPIDGQDHPEATNEDEVEVVPLRVEPVLQQNAPPADTERGQRLIQSCRDGDLLSVQRQVVDGAPAGFVTKTGWTPIAAAAYCGKIEIVRYLLELGADGMYIKTNKRYAKHLSSGNASMSPLSSARTPSSATESLSDAHLTSNASDHSLNGHDNNGSNSTNSLTSASASAQTQVLQALKKALPEGMNTPLHWACYKGHAEVVLVLLHAGYGIEDTDPVGNRCLHLACSGGFQEVVEILLAHSAAVDPRNRYGNRPLDLATEPSCRKLLLKFQSHTTCEWCKEAFSRLRRPSLCQHCHNVYCDVKPCSSITEIVTQQMDSMRPITASSGTVRSLRYCQECASEMGKTEQDLRTHLDAKLELIQSALAILSSNQPSRPVTSRVSRPSSTQSPSRPVTANGTPPSTLPASNETLGGETTPSTSEPGTPALEMEVVEPSATEEGELPPPPRQRRRLTSDEISRALTLSQTDAEALYTSIEAAQAKNVDRELIQRAKRTYHQLVAHVALQQEIKTLMVVRPIGVRSLIEPLKTALANARREGVSDEMLELAVDVIQSAEAECTLFGCHALCAKIELGSKKFRRDIARLEASIDEAQSLNANEKLLGVATQLRDRLNAEVQLQACLQPFTPLTTVSDAGAETVHGYVFEDGAEVPTLLQALELRNQRIQSAVDFGSAVEDVSPALLEDGANQLKQLKKEIKDETKAEEERRRLEEEAAAKAAKKGKKKKA